MNKIIFIPFAYIENAKSGANLKGSNTQKIYIKNLFVAACTAKQWNADSTVAIVTNYEFSPKFKKKLVQNNIQLFKCEFTDFFFNKTYPWCLAFYKLCALNYILSLKEYDVFCMLDSDVVFLKQLETLWVFAKQNLVLYDLKENKHDTNYLKFLRDTELLGYSENIAHYGGEFLAGNSECGLRFINKAKCIYEDMLKKEIIVSTGDEFITSLAVHNDNAVFKNGSDFIYRCWTGTFRRLPPKEELQTLSILHVPAEKKYGLIKLYKILSHHGTYDPQYIFRILHINSPSFITKVKMILKKILRRG